MAISNFTELQTAIAAWSHRTDLTAYLPDFISNAEKRMFSELRVKEMEARATYTPTSRYLDAPDRLTGIRRITAQTTPPCQLEFVSPDGLMQRYSTTNGVPGYFTMLGDEIEFNTIPSCSVEIQYYAAPEALSSTNTTNAILTNYPELYLAACLIEAYLYTVDDANISKWMSVYQDALRRANKKTTAFHTAGPMAVMAR